MTDAGDGEKGGGAEREPGLGIGRVGGGERVPWTRCLLNYPARRMVKGKIRYRSKGIKYIMRRILKIAKAELFTFVLFPGSLAESLWPLPFKSD